MKFSVKKLTFFIIHLLIILLFFYPIGNLLPNYIYLALTAICVFFILACSVDKQVLKYSALNAVILAFTLVRCILAKQTGLSFYSPMNICISRYQIFVYFIVFSHVIKLGRKDKNRIFLFSIFCITVTALISLYHVLFIDPLAVRFSKVDLYWGIGDFQLVYASAILVGPLFWSLFQKGQRLIYKIAMVACFVIIVLFITLSSLVTSIVIALMSIIICVFVKYRHDIKTVFLGIVAIALIVFRKIWAQLILKISQIGIFNYVINDKLIAIANLLMGISGDMDTLDSRNRLMKMSLNTFKENPLLGVNYSNYNSSTVGGHLQWPDDLARFGIIGNLVVWFSYIQMFKFTINGVKSHEAQNALISTWLTIFVLGFLNPCLSGQIIAVLFCVVPSIYD